MQNNYSEASINTISPPDAEALRRQDVVIEKLADFFNKIEGPISDKLRAQYKLVLRKLSGNKVLMGSGVPAEEAHLLANKGETGFLQLGKLHTKGPVNEGTVEFIDRYGWTGTTTKFTDLILVFDPEKVQIQRFEDEEEKLTPEQLAKIEEAGFSSEQVQAIRPGSDVLFAVYDSEMPGLSKEVERIKTEFPHLADKILSIAEFEDRLSDRGLLEGEQKHADQTSIKQLINEVIRLSLGVQGVETFLAFVLEELFPLLSSEEKASAVSKLVEDNTLFPKNKFIDQYPNLGLLRKVTDQLSEEELIIVMQNVIDGFRMEMAFPLIYLKYTSEGIPLPERIKKIVQLHDLDKFFQKFAESNEEEWNVLVELLEGYEDLPATYTYFFKQASGKSHQERIHMAQMRRDFEALSKITSIATLAREILEQDAENGAKKIVRNIRRSLTRGEYVPQNSEKKNTIEFNNRSNKWGTIENVLKIDMEALHDFLGNSWNMNADRPIRPLRIEGSLDKISAIHKWIPKVVPEFADRLRMLEKYYSLQS